MPNRVDDGTVADDEILWRRLLPSWVEADEAGRTRTRSLAFLDRRSGDISVHRASMTTEEFVLRNHPNHGIAALTAKAARDCGCGVAADPMQDEPDTDDDPSHTLIVPPQGLGSSRTKSLAKDLARASTVIREPQQDVQPDANEGTQSER
jgi:hypothetical protein